MRTIVLLAGFGLLSATAAAAAAAPDSVEAGVTVHRGSARPEGEGQAGWQNGAWALAPAAAAFAYDAGPPYAEYDEADGYGSYACGPLWDGHLNRMIERCNAPLRQDVSRFSRSSLFW